jgi:hypothetical protein
MALSLGDRIITDIADGLQQFPPLFGVVTLDDGSAEGNQVRINLQNGATWFLPDTNEEENGVTVITDDDDPEEVVGKKRWFSVGFNSLAGVALRSFRIQGERMVLMLTLEFDPRASLRPPDPQLSRPMYVVVPYADVDW